MTVRLSIICAIAAVGINAFVPAAAYAEGSRPVRVCVIVRDSEHRAVAGVLVGLVVDERKPPVTDAATDDAGIAILETTVSESQLSVGIRHIFAHPSTLSPEEQWATSRRMGDVFSVYHLERTHALDLDAKKAEYELVVTAWPAVEVSGIVVDKHGKPQDGLIFGPPHSILGTTIKGKSKPLRGVRQGVPSLVCFFSYASGAGAAALIRPIQLQAAQTGANVDLGEVRIDSLTGGVSMHVRLIGDAELNEQGAYGYQSGVTFVSEDGALIVAYRGMPEEPQSRVMSRLAAGPDEHPLLPPGRYFIAPGLFFYSDDQVDLIRAVLDGKDLRKSGIPMIEVSRDGPNDFDINVLEAHRAIRAFVHQST